MKAHLDDSQPLTLMVLVMERVLKPIRRTVCMYDKPDSSSSTIEPGFPLACLGGRCISHSLPGKQYMYIYIYISFD